MMNKLKNSIIRFLIKRTCLDISTIYSVLRQSTEKEMKQIITGDKRNGKLKTISC